VTTTPANANRPAPTMFSLQGLRTLPFWTSPNPPADADIAAAPAKSRIAYNDKTVAAVVAHLEKNYPVIKEEYMSAVLGVGNNGVNGNAPMQGDYDVGGDGSAHEGALHTGSWDWHSYIQKGGKVRPLTASDMQDLLPL